MWGCNYSRVENWKGEFLGSDACKGVCREYWWYVHEVNNDVRGCKE